MVRVDVYIEILSHSRSEGRAAYYYRLLWMDKLDVRKRLCKQMDVCKTAGR